MVGTVGIVLMFLIGLGEPARIGGSPAGADVARPATGSVEESTVEELRVLMALRTAELTAPDGGPGPIDSIHPDAPAEVRERREWTVSGLRLLGLDEYVERLLEPVVDLTPPGLATSTGGRRLVVATRRTYRITNVDVRPATETVYLEVGWTPQGWRVLHDDPLRSLGLTSERGIWDVAPIEVVDQGERVLVGAGASPGRLAEVAELLVQAEDALPALEVVDPYLVIVPESADQAARFLQSPLDLSKFVGFVTFSVDREFGWDPGPPRLVLQEDNLALRSTERQVAILAHELVHVAALEDAGPMTSLWVHEGFANWHVSGAVPASGGGVAIPESYEFRSGDVDDIVAAYSAAESLMARMAHILGPDGPQRFFEGLGAVRSVPGTVIFHTDREMARVGVTRSELEG